MTDRQHIRRLRQAMAKLQQARAYASTAVRMVKDAERELKVAVEAAMPKKPGPDGGQTIAA